MLKKLTRVVLPLLLAVLLLTPVGLVGCGDNGGEEVGNKLIFGWDWDFTGRATVGTTQLYTGLIDYLKMTKETDPVPGVEIETMTYDGKSDPARVIVGYKWLRDRGMDLFSCAPHDFKMLRSQLEDDNIPSFIGSTQLENLDAPLGVSLYGPPESQLEVILDWIMDGWDVTVEGRKCKIGFVGLAGVPFYEAQRDFLLKVIDENPDELELTSVEMAPSTTTAWASEIARLKDSDYIAIGASGPPSASFTIEARQRGYHNRIVGPLESLMAFWSLVKSVVPPADLDGCVSGFYFPWYNQEGTYITEVLAAMQKYRSSEVDYFLGGTGYVCGWSYGTVLVDALRRAADAVGGENVTSMDLFQALRETDMTVDGFGGFPWKVVPEANAFMRGVSLYEYKADVEDWVLMQDYVIPSTLGG